MPSTVPAGAFALLSRCAMHGGTSPQRARGRNLEEVGAGRGGVAFVGGRAKVQLSAQWDSGRGQLAH